MGFDGMMTAVVDPGGGFVYKYIAIAVDQEFYCKKAGGFKVPGDRKGYGLGLP